MSYPSRAPSADARKHPLAYIDLDRVLLRSSLALEIWMAAIRRRPALLLWLPLWMWRGGDFVRARLARIAALDVAQLPYREAAVADLRRRAEGGASLVLVTSADPSVARQVAMHLGFPAQAAASAPAGCDCLTAPRRAPAPASMVRLLRPYQWFKNTLVFVPFALSHHIRSLHTWGLACLAFLAFCSVASCAYVVNDILDREDDRQHPRKRFRPIAAGEVALEWALWLPPLLLAMAGLCCAFLPWECAAVLVWYAAAATFYSAVAKERLMADVIILALLHTSRLLMGSLATGNVVSPWLASFSLMLFLSLALCKRVSELITWQSIQYEAAPGRKYRGEDIPVLEMMAVASAFVACLIMVLYLQSGEILRLYRHPEYLWVGVVGLLYWLGRLIIYTHRGKCPDDPLFFIAQDKTTLLVLAVAVVFGFLAV